jgi:hypothetical protein
MLRIAALGLLLVSVVVFPACASDKSVRPAESKNAQVRLALNRPLPPTVAIDMRNVPLRDAISFLADVTGISFHVNWKALDAAGVSGDTQITVRLRNVTPRKVLNTVLSDAAGPDQKLTFYIDEGVVEVTTRDVADGIMYMLVYDVQDLLINYPEDQGMYGNIFNPLMMSGMNMWPGNSGYPGNRGMRSGGRDYMSMNQWPMGTGAPGMTAWPGTSPWNTTPWTPQNPGQTNNQKNTRADELIELIKATIYPKYWTEGLASIRFYNGALVVTAPRIVHEALGGPID